MKQKRNSWVLCLLTERGRKPLIILRRNRKKIESKNIQRSKSWKTWSCIFNQFVIFSETKQKITKFQIQDHKQKSGFPLWGSWKSLKHAFSHGFLDFFKSKREIKQNIFLFFIFRLNFLSLKSDFFYIYFLCFLSKQTLSKY